jgi:anti-sigma regulatory factor (Ser/Thr protein kinase)
MSPDRAYSHQALFYRSPAEYVSGIVPFVSQGASTGEAVMVAVPRPKETLLRPALGDTVPVQFVDMLDLGRNPGRIIPAVLEFLQDQAARPSRIVDEPIWAGRTRAEITEATRHEALLNLALEGSAVQVLCPYDFEALPEDVLADARRTHPEFISGGVTTRSTEYLGAGWVRSDGLWPLPPPPSTGAVNLPFDDLTELRSFVRHYSAGVGLGQDRAEDLVLVVSELGSNSIRHGAGPGTLHLWQDGPGAIVAEVYDAGRMMDLLAGRHPPGPGREARGLWLVNQLCDLVEVRSGPRGTRVRVRVEHHDRDTGPPWK